MGESVLDGFLNPPVGAMLWRMRKLLTILTDSFLIWSKNITLIYVFFLGLLLLSLSVSQPEAPSLALRWILMLAVGLVLFTAIMAGWYNMVALACIRYLGTPNKSIYRERAVIDAFTLFQAFLPGVGQFFLPVLGGYLIQWGMTVLLLVPVYPLLVKNLPLLEKLPTSDFLTLYNTLDHLPIAQVESLNTMILSLLGALAVNALFSWLTLLWPAFVIVYDENPLKACYRSILQFFRDPLRLLGLSLLLFTIWLPLFLTSKLLVTLNNMLLGAACELTLLLLFIYAAVSIFVYTIQTLGLPQPKSTETPQSGSKPKSGPWTEENDDRRDGFSD